MLILSRKKGERIRIGDDVEIVVQRFQGDKVRIGIDAPKDVLILRSELGSAKQSAEQDAE